MTKWNTTDEAATFIASGDSRETSPEIMRAIAFFATSLEEAEATWADGEMAGVCHMSDIWEHVTGNGRREATDFCWGASGSHWMDGA
jgi:hypothetical protein